MTKEKKAIMDVLQSHGFWGTQLTSDFAREQIADESMEAQKVGGTEALSEMGLELK